MVIGWPQGILLFLLCVELGMGMQAHGTPREPHNGWHTLVDISVIAFLLYWGGFFS